MSGHDSIARRFECVRRARSIEPRSKGSVHAQLFGEQPTERITTGPAPISCSPSKGASRGAERPAGFGSSEGGDRDPPNGPSERIGRFIVLGPLGCGGMGTVVRAFDERLDREVAIKVVHSHVAVDHGRRMLREAQAMARLSHPNVVQVYEVGEQSSPFIVMELVRGQSLRDWCQQAEPRWDTCVEVYLQAGRGLSAAHAKGLIHRDFKPSNCIIDDEGRVRVLDFGLAMDAKLGTDRVGEGQPPGRDEIVASLSSSAFFDRITETGSVVGTRAYMAPEQLAECSANAHSDQFSFCVALYEAIYGQLPFPDERDSALLDMASGVRRVPRPVPATTRAPRWIARVLWRGLSAQPHARWPSMDALLHELEHRHRRGRWSLLVVAGAVLILVAVSLLGLSRAAFEPSDQDVVSLPRKVWPAGSDPWVRR